MKVENLIIDSPDFITHWLDTDAYLVVATNNFEYDIEESRIDDFVETIIDSLKETNKRLICFNVIAEGLPFGILTTVNRIVKKMLALDFTTEHFTIISGASAHYRNYDFYKKSVERYDWILLSIIFVNNYELLFLDKINRKPDIYPTINQTPKKKSKKFLCYNRNVKAHRVYLTAMLMSRNLLDQGFFSMYLNGGLPHGIHENTRYNFNDLQRYFPKTWHIASDILEKNAHMFPITLTLNNNNEEVMHEITKTDFDHYDDSYFGIITETKYFHDDPSDLQRLKNDLSLEGYLFSEKTYKFIAGKLPFIIVGFSGSIRALQELGYKTFHPYIDEGYDAIEDDEERMTAIVKEIERLCNLRDDQWLLIQERLKEVVDHNFNVLLNATPQSHWR